MTLAKPLLRYDSLKRFLDVMGAIIGLICAAPIAIAIAGLVALYLGRPVLFKQDRPGKNGEIFSLYKFRSMRDVDVTLGLLTDEQRLTPFGRTLRATSLDEIPTLAHVLRGQMSMVGPRPLLVSYLPLYTRDQFRRHEVRPGITGLAQVGGRNALDWNEKFALDLEYVEKKSLLLDAKIMTQTIKAVISRRGITSKDHVTSPGFTGDGSGAAAQ